MDLFFLETAFEVIDTRSFSNMWFWIGLAVMWSSASHWVIGVPFDMVRRARGGHAQSAQDMVALARIQARRLTFIADATGVLTTALTFFAITMLSLLGFLYRIEFAQAVLLLFAPMMVVAWLSLRTARRIGGMEAPQLADALMTHRRNVQFVGVVSIFVTSLWGMWINVNATVLG